jgi:peroxiredoxin Q/BCP
MSRESGGEAAQFPTISPRPPAHLDREPMQGRRPPGVCASPRRHPLPGLSLLIWTIGDYRRPVTIRLSSWSRWIISPIQAGKATKGRRMAHDLEPGDKAPAFKLERDGGGAVSLKDFKGRKLVLYFYPKADTPGCTREAIDFSRLRSQFAKAGTDILGVSADPVEKQDKFKTKHKLTVALGSDTTHEMLLAYGTWGKKSLYGRLFNGVFRKTFLIDENARVARVWPKVSVNGHADEVLAAAKML